MEQYHFAISNILHDYLAIKHPYKNLDFELIIDRDSNTYCIFIYGLHNGENIHKCIFHLKIKGDRIIILRDNTKYDVFEKLLMAGIPGDRIIYQDISQAETQDFKLTNSLEKIYEQYSSLFETKPNFSKGLKSNVSAEKLIELEKIGNDYLDCAIAQHPNASPSILSKLFLRYPVQVLTNLSFDLLLFEQPQFIDDLFYNYHWFFRSKGLKPTDDLKAWAKKQKNQNYYFGETDNSFFPAIFSNKLSDEYRYYSIQNLCQYSWLPLNTKNNPQELMNSLDLFLSAYYGDRQIEERTILPALKDPNLPLPLKYLYSFIDKYRGIDEFTGKPRYTFGIQDTLYNPTGFEDDKRRFLGENQGVWDCHTENTGIDPPVWIHGSRSTDAMEYVCDSLAEFLVTYCLQEAVFNSTYEWNLDNGLKDLMPIIKQYNLELTLLWRGVYAWDVCNQRRYDLTYFYLVENSILIWNGWCGTNYKNAWRLFNS